MSHLMVAQGAVTHRSQPVRLVPDPSAPKRVRIVDAALACIADQGLRGTTVDDVARRAGMSRATLYRAMPGGRDAIVQAVVDTELARFFTTLAVAMGTATSLEDVLVSGMASAAAAIQGSAALTTVLDEEPWVILRHLSFDEMDHAIAVAADFAEPFFGRWLEPAQAIRAADLAVRIVVSYLLDPDPGVDLTEVESVRVLARRHVLPGIEALRRSSGVA